jgi:hypothetical protein
MLCSSFGHCLLQPLDLPFSPGLGGMYLLFEFISTSFPVPHLFRTPVPLLPFTSWLQPYLVGGSFANQGTALAGQSFVLLYSPNDSQLLRSAPLSPIQGEVLPTCDTVKILLTVCIPSWVSLC